MVYFVLRCVFISPSRVRTLSISPIQHVAQDVSQQDIEAAAKLASAHDFITSLPSGYDTNVSLAAISAIRSYR